MFRRYLTWVVILFLGFSQTLLAQDNAALRTQSNEGMWLPLKANKLNYEDMSKMGFELPKEKLYNEEAPSLEDGIVKLDGGSCSAEIISPQGLVLTNHHCAYDAIASLSSEDNDLLTDGFWSKSMEDELPIEGSTAAFLVHSEEVTAQLLDANGELADNFEEKINELTEKATEGTHYEAEIEQMFHGSEYYLFVYEVFKDVRLVGAPPSSIGKFGGDTDNWMWPRHTGDFSLLRVYAGPDNKPAEYSADNKPYKPVHYFPISLKGVDEFDYAMIMGYPGSTSRYLTSTEIKLALNRTNLDQSHLLGLKGRIMKEAMDQDDAVRIALASDYASLMNYYKYLIGQTTMMNRYDVPGEKEEEENGFLNWVAKDEKRKEKYGTVLQDIAKIHDGIEETDQFMTYFNFSLSQVQSLNLAYKSLSLLNAPAGEEEMVALLEETKEMSDEHFKTFYYDIDKDVFTAFALSLFENVPEDLHPNVFASILAPPPPPPVIEEVAPVEEPEKPKKKKKKRRKKKNKKAEPAPEPVTITEVMPEPPVVEELSDEEKIARWVEVAYLNSIFTDKGRYEAFLESPSPQGLQQDPIMRYLFGLAIPYQTKVLATASAFDEELEPLSQTYIQGLREMKSDKSFYPDANSTMRISYGRVLAYEPRDGVFYDYYTTIDGVMEKEDPESDEFMVEPKLKELWMKEDFGRYANDEGELVTCFLTNNDITGGNSGSPVLNSRGELIGVAFDGNWESMASDIHIFPQFNRTISVDIRYVLFVIDKLAGATRLIEEMTIVE